jgi:CII-binding regulator of phage lambda lysogenization HflD
MNDLLITLMKVNDPIQKIRYDLNHDEIAGCLGDRPDLLNKLHTMAVIHETTAKGLTIALSRLLTVDQRLSDQDEIIQSLREQVRSLTDQLEFTKL